MTYLLAALVIIPVAALVIAAIRGRAQVRPCCTVDPEKDARMRTAMDTPAHDRRTQSLPADEGQPFAPGS